MQVSELILALVATALLACVMSVAGDDLGCYLPELPHVQFSIGPSVQGPTLLEEFQDRQEVCPTEVNH